MSQGHKLLEFPLTKGASYVAFDESKKNNSSAILNLKDVKETDENKKDKTEDEKDKKPKEKNPTFVILYQ